MHHRTSCNVFACVTEVFRMFHVTPFLFAAFLWVARLHAPLSLLRFQEAKESRTIYTFD